MGGRQDIPFDAESSAGEVRFGDSLHFDGNLWRLFSTPARFAYLMGIAQPLAALRGSDGPTSLTEKDALAHLLPALRDEPLREVARQLDLFYAERPDERGRSVLDALIVIYVLPRLALARGEV